VSTAGATTVLKLSLKDLAKKSDSIVRARVEDEVARYDTNKEIYTYFTLRVLEPVKGSKKDDIITIRQLGGVVDHIASIVPGTPSFKKGEEVVVFLTQKDAAGYPWVMGLQQGKYSVSQDENGQKRVRNELDGTTLVGANGTVTEGAKVTPNMPLEAFLAGIRTDLDAAGKVKVDPTPQTE
jgi:predicted secreted protein